MQALDDTRALLAHYEDELTHLTTNTTTQRRRESILTSSSLPGLGVSRTPSALLRLGLSQTPSSLPKLELARTPSSFPELGLSRKPSEGLISQSLPPSLGCCVGLGRCLALAGAGCLPVNSEEPNWEEEARKFHRASTLQEPNARVKKAPELELT